MQILEQQHQSSNHAGVCCLVVHQNATRVQSVGTLHCSLVLQPMLNGSGNLEKNAEAVTVILLLMEVYNQGRQEDKIRRWMDVQDLE